MFGSAPCSIEQRHGRHVAGKRGAPERRGADFVDAGEVEVVFRVPDLLGEAQVRIGALLEQRLHEVEIRDLLLVEGARLRIERARRPGHVERGIERRHAVARGGIRIRALIEQPLGEIEVAVDGGDQQRAGLVARADLVHIGAARRRASSPHRCSRRARRGSARCGRPACRSARCRSTGDRCRACRPIRRAPPPPPPPPCAGAVAAPAHPARSTWPFRPCAVAAGLITAARRRRQEFLLRRRSGCRRC